MSYWIITVGSELVTGLTPDTNSTHIAARLGKEGFRCERAVSIGDDVSEIARIVSEAVACCDGAVVTGGLGPTTDDVTREGIAAAAGVSLELKPHLKDFLDRWYLRFGAVQESVYRQAYIPRGAVEIPAVRGSAAGFLLGIDGKAVLALPGVPGEMNEMLERAIPHLKERWEGGPAYVIRNLMTVARSESWLESAVSDLIDNEGVSFGFFAEPGLIKIQLRAEAEDRASAESRLDEVEARVRSRLGRTVFGSGDDTLPKATGDLLLKTRMTVAIAESCTGGLIAKLLTDIPGSSAYVIDSVVAYSNKSKTALLGVSSDILERYGAVSPECALAMARGARALPGADIGLSVTGIAGPGGGTEEKPVGLVYVGLSTGDREDTWEYRLPGSRRSIRERSSKIALDALRNYLLDALEGA